MYRFVIAGGDTEGRVQGLAGPDEAEYCASFDIEGSVCKVQGILTVEPLAYPVS